MDALFSEEFKKKIKKIIRKRNIKVIFKCMRPISLKKLTASIKHSLKSEHRKLFFKELEGIIQSNPHTLRNTSGVKNLTCSDEKEKNYIKIDYHSSQNTLPCFGMSQEEVDQWRTKNKIIIQDIQSEKKLSLKDEFDLKVPLISFSSFRCRQHLHAKLIQLCVEEKGFNKPSQVQAQCWPILLNRRDMVAISETGSGKTLAFVLPVLMILSTKRATSANKDQSVQPQALVIAPTRELAIQSHTVFLTFGKALSLKSMVLCGGVSKYTQIVSLNRYDIDIIVATPGRLRDLVQDRYCSLSMISILILDEADRMLDMGFEEDVKFIIQKSPSHLSGRLTAMFSATWPKCMKQIAYQYMNNPLTIYFGFDNNQNLVKDEFRCDNDYRSLRANPNVKQNIEVLNDFARQGRLCQLIKSHFSISSSNKNRILIFGLYKKEVSRLEIFLNRNGWKDLVTSIHGNKRQRDRINALQSFKTGTTPILIATDVAARGLDIPDVQLVINFTFPLTIEDYVHRIGRTGRAGNKGVSYTFFQEKDREHAGKLQQILKNAGQNIPKDLKKFGTVIIKKKKEHDLYGNYGPSSSTVSINRKAKRFIFNSDGDEEEV